MGLSLDPSPVSDPRDEGWDDEPQDSPAQHVPNSAVTLYTPADLQRMTRKELMRKDHRGLTPRMQAFVVAYTKSGGNATAAAKATGVAPETAHVVGSRWLRKSEVIAAIKSEVGLALVAALPAIAREQVRLACHARSEFVRQQAGAKLMDQVGLDLPEARTGRVTVSIDLS